MKNYDNTITVYPTNRPMENDCYWKPGFFYLHGKLENKAGTDLCLVTIFAEDESPEEGFPCKVVIGSETVNAMLFCWLTHYGIKGLIVDCKDTYYIKDATGKRKLKITDL